jgi:hypothetical protein
MYQFIIFLGVFLALVGAGAIAAGAPSWALGLGLGSSLIQSGSMGIVGGLLLVGIGLVLRALQDLSRRIDLISAGTVPPARVAAPAPAPRAPAKREPLPSRREPPLMPQRDELNEPALAEEADEGAFEPRPRGRSWPPATDARPAETRTSERPRAPAEPPPSRGDFAEPRRSRFAPERRPEPAPDMRGPRGGGEASTVVVRSGIIHGMAYTLYADGSIEAELPIGTVRFASIEELQDHVSRTGDEADVDFVGKPTG